MAFSLHERAAKKEEGRAQQEKSKKKKLGLPQRKQSEFHYDPGAYTILRQDTVNLNYENHGERSPRPQ